MPSLPRAVSDKPTDLRETWDDKVHPQLFRTVGNISPTLVAKVEARWSNAPLSSDEDPIGIVV